MSQSRVQFFCSWFCPFAQRAWISLLERKVDFEYMEINPYDKTKEFLEINPRGLIPVIVKNGQCVYESAVCIEYIDEEWSNQGNPLLPFDPYKRALVRIWSDFITKKIMPVFYQILMSQSEEKQEECKQEMLRNLEIFCKEMSGDGPYFMGEAFGMVDIMLLPFTLRFVFLKQFRNFELPDTPNLLKLKKWMEVAHNRDSVKVTLPDIYRLRSQYEKYANNSAHSKVAEAIRAGNVLP